MVLVKGEGRREKAEHRKTGNGLRSPFSLLPSPLTGGESSSLPRAQLPAPRFEDLRVAGTAAQVARQADANLGVSGLRRTIAKTDRGEDHAWRADAALRAAMSDEGFLHGVQLLAAGDPFDRRHRRTRDLKRRN